jgi:hypothetical protein
MAAMSALAFAVRPRRHPEQAPAWERRWYSSNHLMQSSEVALRTRIDEEIHGSCERLREYRRRLRRSDDMYLRGVTERRIRETSRSLEHWRALRREGLRWAR